MSFWENRPKCSPTNECKKYCFTLTAESSSRKMWATTRNKKNLSRCLSYQKLQIFVITNICNLLILHIVTFYQHSLVGHIFSHSFLANATKHDFPNFTHICKIFSQICAKYLPNFYEYL
jgi:hypothetical protein